MQNKIRQCVKVAGTEIFILNIKHNKSFVTMKLVNSYLITSQEISIFKSLRNINKIYSDAV